MPQSRGTAAVALKSTMKQADRLAKISIADYESRLTEPFTMVELARIDDLSLSLYLCQGTMPFHRHVDQDELFMVHSGAITLESAWGTAVLRPGELAVVAKGLSHRSSSPMRSLVLLLQPRLMVNRRNGDRHLFTLRDQGRLEKVSMPAVGRGLTVPFRPVVLADVDTFAVTLESCTQAGPLHGVGPLPQSGLILCSAGHVTVETEDERLPLAEWELVVVPAGVPYRLSSAAGALVMGVQRHRQPSLPLPN